MAENTGRKSNAAEDISEDRQATAIAWVLAAANEDDAIENWKVEVRRVSGSGVDTLGNKQPILFYCGVQDLESLPLQLQKYYLYGERYGYFRAWVRNKGVLARVIDYTIEADPRNPPESNPVPAPAVAVAAPARQEAAPSDIQILLAEIRRQNDQMAALMSAQQSQAPKTMSDTIKEMAAMMAIFKEMMPAPSNTAAETLKTAVELAKEFASNSSGGGGGWTDVVTAVVNSPVLGELAQGVLAARAQQQQPPNNGQQPRNVPQPVPPRVPPPGAAPAPQAPAVPDATGQTIVLELRDTLAFLVGKASEGADPKLWADYTFNKLPQFAFDAIDNTEDPLTALASFNPAVSNYRPWFDALLDSLYDIAEAKRVASDPANAAQPSATVVADSGAGRASGNA